MERPLSLARSRYVRQENERLLKADGATAAHVGTARLAAASFGGLGRLRTVIDVGAHRFVVIDCEKVRTAKPYANLQPLTRSVPLETVGSR